MKCCTYISQQKNTQENNKGVVYHEHILDISNCYFGLNQEEEKL